jgi:hypothetical protein
MQRDVPGQRQVQGDFRFDLIARLVLLRVCVRPPNNASNSSINLYWAALRDTVASKMSKLPTRTAHFPCSRQTVV